MTSKCDEKICKDSKKKCCIANNFILSDHKPVCNDEILTFNIGGNEGSRESVVNCDITLRIKGHEDPTEDYNQREISRINFILDQIYQVAEEKKYKYICLQEVPKYPLFDKFEKIKYKIIGQHVVHKVDFSLFGQKIPIFTVSSVVEKETYVYWYPSYFDIPSYNRKFHIVQLNPPVYFSLQDKNGLSLIGMLYYPEHNKFSFDGITFYEMEGMTGFDEISDTYIAKTLELDSSTYYIVDNKNFIYYNIGTNQLYSKKPKHLIRWSPLTNYQLYIDEFLRIRSESKTEEISMEDYTTKLTEILNQKQTDEKYSQKIIKEMNILLDDIIGTINIINIEEEGTETIKSLMNILPPIINILNAIIGFFYTTEVKDAENQNDEYRENMNILKSLQIKFNNCISKYRGEFKSAINRKQTVIRMDKQIKTYLDLIDTNINALTKIKKNYDDMIKKFSIDLRQEGGTPYNPNQTVTLYLEENGEVGTIENNTYQIVGLKLNKELIVNCKFPPISWTIDRHKSILSEFKKYICKQIKKYTEEIDKIIIVGDLNVVESEFEKHFLLSESEYSSIKIEGVSYIIIIEKKDFNNVLGKYECVQEVKQIERKYVKYKLKYLNLKLLQNVR